MKNRLLSILKKGHESLLNPPINNVSVLDLLRSIAILMVLCGHAVGEYLHYHSHNALTRLPVFFYGWTGVDLFFVLSGFLIGKQIWKEFIKTGKVDFFRFFLRRGLRIWPLFYFFIFLNLIVLKQYELGFGRIWPDLIFLSNYRQGIVSGAWSLATEEQFYIIFPLLFVTILRWVPLRWHGLALCLILFSQPFIRWLTLVFATGPTRIGYFSILTQPIHTHCDGLVIGLILAWASLYHPGWMKKKGWSENVLILFLGIVLAMFIRRIDQDLFAFSALAIIFGVWVWVSMRDQTIYTKFSSWKGFYIISRLSYGMYLNHFLVLPIVIPLMLKIGIFGSFGFFIILTASILTSVIFSWVAFLCIEFPFLLWRDKVLSQRNT